MIPQPNPQRWPGPCGQSFNYGGATPSTITLTLSAMAAVDFGTSASGGATTVYTRDNTWSCAAGKYVAAYNAALAAYNAAIAAGNSAAATAAQAAMAAATTPANNTFALCQDGCCSPSNPSFVLGNVAKSGDWTCSAAGESGDYTGDWGLTVGIELENGLYSISGDAQPYVTGSPSPPWTNYCWNGLGFGFGASGLTLAQLIGTHTFSNYTNPTFYSNATVVIE